MNWFFSKSGGLVGDLLGLGVSHGDHTMPADTIITRMIEEG